MTRNSIPGDLVFAFTDGGYELGGFPPAAVAAAVPEPAGLTLLGLGTMMLAVRPRLVSSTFRLAWYSRIFDDTAHNKTR